MNTRKSLLTLATTAFVTTGIFVMSVSVVSASVDQENKNTGPHSVNKNIAKSHEHKSKLEKRIADLRNRVKQRHNTGHVKQVHNTKSGDVKTGRIDVFVDVVNKANEGDDCGCPDEDKDGDHHVSVTQTNKNTGPGSTNKNIVKSSSSKRIKKIDIADVRNNIMQNFNTGHVVQKGNTNSGDVTTGNINVGISIKNVVNS